MDDLQTDPNGETIIRDDVRLGGAIEDVGADAGRRGEQIETLVESNREDVARATGGAPRKRKR